MAFELAAVDPADAGDLVRQVDFPAMQDGPLYRLISPDPSTLTEDAREEILQWYIDGLGNALKNETGNLRQLRTPEGKPVGFCKHCTGCGLPGLKLSRFTHKLQKPLPGTLNLESWHRVSIDLRTAREQALAGLQNVCRMYTLDHLQFSVV